MRAFAVLLLLLVLVPLAAGHHYQPHPNHTVLVPEVYEYRTLPDAGTPVAVTCVFVNTPAVYHNRTEQGYHDVGIQFLGVGLDVCYRAPNPVAGVVLVPPYNVCVPFPVPVPTIIFGTWHGYGAEGDGFSLDENFRVKSADGSEERWSLGPCGLP